MYIFFPEDKIFPLGDTEIDQTDYLAFMRC